VTCTLNVPCSCAAAAPTTSAHTHIAIASADVIRVIAGPLHRVSAETGLKSF
jgi:hypothetical protein